MKCNQIKDLLSPYLDNELKEEERSLVVTHLKNCPQCRRELQSLLSARQYLKNYPVIQPSQEFDQPILAALHQAKEKQTPNTLSHWLSQFLYHPAAQLGLALLACLLMTSIGTALLKAGGVRATQSMPGYTKNPPQMPLTYQGLLDQEMADLWWWESEPVDREPLKPRGFVPQSDKPQEVSIKCLPIKSFYFS